MGLEVGNVYSRGKRGRLHLAVGPNLLVYVVDTEIVEVYPSSDFRMVRSITVEELLVAWETTTTMLNQITETYLQPKIHIDRNKRPKRKSGTKPTHDEELEQFIILRRHRLEP